MTGPSGAGNSLRMAGAGVQLAAALIGGLYGGQWLDRRLGTAPVFLYVGVALGAIGGMTALYRQLMRLTREEEEAGKR
jgi:ATP synthase protein I